MSKKKPNAKRIYNEFSKLEGKSIPAYDSSTDTGKEIESLKIEIQDLLMRAEHLSDDFVKNCFDSLSCFVIYRENNDKVKIYYQVPGPHNYAKCELPSVCMKRK